MILSSTSCIPSNDSGVTKIIFLHHSTGQNIWNGNRSTAFSKITGLLSQRLSSKFNRKASLPELFGLYNKAHDTSYVIKELVFPKRTPYGWHNYPYDYYNIWVKNAGDISFMEEPTLEMLTKEYKVIVFKHCFPVSNIQNSIDSGNIESDFKSIANYKLQYLALRDKFSEFPGTKFILFTGAARVKSQISEEEAKRAKEFFDWVVNEWDLPGDNIYLWDLYKLQTEGGIYLEDSKAFVNNSHPNEIFSGYATSMLFNRIIDVIETNGCGTTLTGYPQKSEL